MSATAQAQSDTPVDDDDNAGAFRSDPQPTASQPDPASHHCISATIQSQMARHVSMPPKEARKTKTKLCHDVLDDLNATVFPAWKASSYLVWAVVSLEFGKNLSGAHLQYGAMHSSTEAAAKVVKQFTKKMRDVLKKHVGCCDAHPMGVVTWSLREVHIHTDPKYLKGYCWKDHVRVASVQQHPHAVVNLSYDELQVAYQYYMTARSSHNEGGTGTLNLSRPGQSIETSTMTRTSVLPEVEYFEHVQGLAPLGLSVGKLVSCMIASDHSQLHPMFASGANVSGPNPVLQNVWLQLRKRPRLADGDGVMLVNKLLYAEPEYDATRDLQVDAAMHGLKAGPAYKETNSLSYAQCMMAVRSGELPDGTPLDADLNRHVGQGLVLSLTAGPAQADAQNCVEAMERGSLKVVKHIANLGFASISDLLAAAGARMLSSFQEPFTLKFADFVMRLTHPTLIELLRDMIDEGGSDDSTAPPLNSDNFATIMSGMAPEGAGAEHAWLLKLPRSDVDLGDEIIQHSEFAALLNTSLDAYEVGVPRLHIRIVQSTHSGQAHGTFFVCAWQLSLAQMHRLERRSQQHSQQYTGSSSGAGPSSSAATLMSLMANAQNIS